MNYEMSTLEKVKLLNHVFFKVHGFSGNTVNHQDPQNSYLNLVLESKKGNQISLALIYSLVAQKLDIPIYGVRSEESRVGKECVSTCSSELSTYHKKKPTKD